MRMLRENHVGIEAFSQNKILVRAGFDDAPLVQDEDAVGAANGAETMRDDKGGAPEHEVFEGLMNEAF